jgi:hypothetical protein
MKEAKSFEGNKNFSKSLFLCGYFYSKQEFIFLANLWVYEISLLKQDRVFERRF